VAVNVSTELNKSVLLATLAEKKIDFLAWVSWIYVFNNVLKTFLDLDVNNPTDQSSVLKN
jgi:hypothetical protein